MSSFIGDVSAYDKSKVVTLDDKKSELIKVVIQAPDKDGFFNVLFSRPVRLAANCTKWSYENEGAEKLLIEYVPTNATLTFMYDWDLEVEMKWHVRSLSGVTKVNSTDLNSSAEEDSQGDRRL